jgi:hypothetical protein
MAWLIVDLRWMANRVRQFQQSWTALHSQSIDERINLYDTGVFHDWLATLVDTQLGPQPRRVLLVPDPKLHEYFGLRSKYELLPHSVAVSSRLPTPAELAGIDYVLFLGDFLPEGADPGLVENVQERYIVLPVAPEIRAMLKPVDFSTRGLLFSVRGRPPGQ